LICVKSLPASLDLYGLIAAVEALDSPAVCFMV